MKEFFNKYRYYFIGAVLVVAVLAAAFFIGGNQSGTETTAAATADSAVAGTTQATEIKDSYVTVTEPLSTAASSAATQPAVQTTAANNRPTAISVTKPTTQPSVSEKPQTTAPAETSKPQNKYKTDPVPSGKPQPVEPQTQSIADKKSVCTISVSCASVLQLESIPEAVADVMPDDGMILNPVEVTFNEGENVFDVLKSVCREKNIHMEFQMTPVYNSAYIEGINNIYEFDCGAGSGWMYRVNGWFPNYGCSRYEVKDGDVIEWLYTCNLGRDIGGEYVKYTD